MEGGIRKNLEAAALALGIGMKRAGQPDAQVLTDGHGLGYYKKTIISGGNGKPFCNATAKRRRKLRNAAISHQRRLARERSR